MTKQSRLVLGRKEGQKILIGSAPNQTVLTVKRIDRNQVSLMFEGSFDVPIDRWEVAEAKGLIIDDET